MIYTKTRSMNQSLIELSKKPKSSFIFQLICDKSFKYAKAFLISGQGLNSSNFAKESSRPR